MNVQIKATLAALALCGAATIAFVAVPRSAPTPMPTRVEQTVPAPAPVRASELAPATNAPASTYTRLAEPTTPTPSSAALSATAIVIQPIKVGDEPIKPIPSVEEFFEDYLGIETNPAKIELGQILFHDPRLSHDNTISCASCHDLRFGGIDRSRTAIGVEGHVGPINTPTVFNAALNIQQFWDGRAEDLERQADGPPNAAGEMASNWPEINSKLLQDAQITSLVRRAYDLEGELPADIGKDHWLEAISDFERTLITPGAPFDAYLQGDENAVSQAVKEGYQLFKDVGCIECHNGMGVGGGTFQKLGRKNPYFGSHSSGVDLGRFNVTKNEADRNVFKVPGLRNVGLTGPWFHDGSQLSLHDAIRTMANVQLDRDLPQADVERIATFLESLTGTFDGRSVDLHGTLK